MKNAETVYGHEYHLQSLWVSKAKLKGDVQSSRDGVLCKGSCIVTIVAQGKLQYIHNHAQVMMSFVISYDILDAIYTFGL